MRRLLPLILCALALPACSGEHGDRAQQLLARAETAQARLTSATYEARIAFTMDGQRMSLVLDGGGYFKGSRAGDQLLTMRTDGVPALGAVDMQLLVRRGRATMTMNGRHFSLPVPPTASANRQYDFSSTMLDLARYVKRVSVREGRVVNGEPGVTIAGVIDTEAMVKALAKLDDFAQAANVDKFTGSLGDIHAAVFVSQRTGLVRSAAITMAIEADGKKADIDVTYRLKTTNRAVAGL
jgi:hypothetical protein